MKSNKKFLIIGGIILVLIIELGTLLFGTKVGDSPQGFIENIMAKMLCNDREFHADYFYDVKIPKSNNEYGLGGQLVVERSGEYFFTKHIVKFTPQECNNDVVLKIARISNPNKYTLFIGDKKMPEISGGYIKKCSKKAETYAKIKREPIQLIKFIDDNPITGGDYNLKLHFFDLSADLLKKEFKAGSSVFEHRADLLDESFEHQIDISKIVNNKDNKAKSYKMYMVVRKGNREAVKELGCFDFKDITATQMPLTFTKTNYKIRVDFFNEKDSLGDYELLKCLNNLKERDKKGFIRLAEIKRFKDQFSGSEARQKNFPATLGVRLVKNYSKEDRELEIKFVTEGSFTSKIKIPKGKVDEKKIACLVLKSGKKSFVTDCSTVIPAKYFGKIEQLIVEQDGGVFQIKIANKEEFNFSKNKYNNGVMPAFSMNKVRAVFDNREKMPAEKVNNTVYIGGSFNGWIKFEIAFLTVEKYQQMRKVHVAKKNKEKEKLIYNFRLVKKIQIPKAVTKNGYNVYYTFRDADRYKLIKIESIPAKDCGRERNCPIYFDNDFISIEPYKKILGDFYFMIPQYLEEVRSFPKNKKRTYIPLYNIKKIRFAEGIFSDYYITKVTRFEPPEIGVTFIPINDKK